MKQWLLPRPQSITLHAGGGGCLSTTATNACPAAIGIPGAHDPDRPELSILEGLVPLRGIHPLILSLTMPSRHLMISGHPNAFVPVTQTGLCNSKPYPGPR